MVSQDEIDWGVIENTEVRVIPGSIEYLRAVSLERGFTKEIYRQNIRREDGGGKPVLCFILRGPADQICASFLMGKEAPAGVQESLAQQILAGIEEDGFESERRRMVLHGSYDWVKEAYDAAREKGTSDGK